MKDFFSLWVSDFVNQLNAVHLLLKMKHLTLDHKLRLSIRLYVSNVDSLIEVVHFDVLGLVMVKERRLLDRRYHIGRPHILAHHFVSRFIGHVIIIIFDRVLRIV